MLRQNIHTHRTSIIGNMLFFAVIALWPGSAGASSSVTASKSCDATGCNVVTAAFTITTTQRIEWTATYNGSPTQGHSFYLTQNSQSNMADIPLTTSGQGFGTHTLGPGTYYIAIKLAVMEPGFYTVTYNISSAHPVNNTSQAPTSFAVSLDFGVGIPHSTFSNFIDTGFSFNAGLEYEITPHFSAEGVFGYHRFPARGVFGGDLNLYQFSGNARAYVLPPANKFRPFFNGGIGAYRFGAGSTEFGANVGAGVLYEITPKFGIQGKYNFHNVFTSGSGSRFSTVQAGARFRF